MMKACNSPGRHAACLTILSCEVLDDVRSAAWLVSEVWSGADQHPRHQMADICEKDNVDAVWRVLGIAAAELRMELRKILLPERGAPLRNTLRCPESWIFCLRRGMPEAPASYLREKIHEYMVARVMSDRTAAILPGAAPYWRDRASEALAAVRSAATGSLTAGRARRPLLPP